MTGVRWFVYDVRGDMEDFVASFADVADAREFGRTKFGDNAYVTNFALHEKAASVGRMRPYKVKRR